MKKKDWLDLLTLLAIVLFCIFSLWQLERFIAHHARGNSTIAKDE